MAVTLSFHELTRKLVFPGDVVNYSPKSFVINSVFMSKKLNPAVFTRHIFSPDSLYLFVRQFRVPNIFSSKMINTTTRITSSLLETISDIIPRCPKPKVLWSNTRRIVARMTNIHTARYFSIMDKIRVSMRTKVLVVQSKDSIASVLQLSPNPVPALTGLINFAPKSFNRILNLTSHMAGLYHLKEVIL